jgi:hypothetical protein
MRERQRQRDRIAENQKRFSNGWTLIVWSHDWCLAEKRFDSGLHMHVSRWQQPRVRGVGGYQYRVTLYADNRRQVGNVVGVVLRERTLSKACLLAETGIGAWLMAQYAAQMLAVS